MHWQGEQTLNPSATHYSSIVSPKTNTYVGHTHFPSLFLHICSFSLIYRFFSTLNVCLIWLLHIEKLWIAVSHYFLPPFFIPIPGIIFLQQYLNYFQSFIVYSFSKMQFLQILIEVLSHFISSVYVGGGNSSLTIARKLMLKKSIYRRAIKGIYQNSLQGVVQLVQQRLTMNGRSQILVVVQSTRLESSDGLQYFSWSPKKQVPVKK